MSESGLGYFQVEAIHGNAAERVLQEVDNEINRLMLEREVLKADRRRDKQAGQTLPRLSAPG